MLVCVLGWPVAMRRRAVLRLCCELHHDEIEREARWESRGGEAVPMGGRTAGPFVGLAIRASTDSFESQKRASTNL